jgi:polyvinyl alcohol dehydrogenase (cytochrome)
MGRTSWSGRAGLVLTAAALALAACAGPPDPAAADPGLAAPASGLADPAPVVAASASVLAAASSAQTEAGAPHPGEAVYRRACALCHDRPDETRAPSLEQVRALGSRQLRLSLVEGVMQPMAAGLGEGELADLIAWLSDAGLANAAWIERMACPADRRAVDVDAAPVMTSFGLGLRNERRLSAGEAGLTTADMRRLELKWAIAFPGATSMRGQPAIVGSTLFLPVQHASRVFALDAETACVKWVYEAEGNLRTSAAFGELAGRKAVVFGDGAGLIHAVDAASGKRLWATSVKVNPASSLTGTPLIHRGRVYVPVSAGEVGRAAQDSYECCTAHGAAHALDGADGRILWTAHMTAPATEQGVNAAGARVFGPSGAVIWSSPSIDEKRGLLYVTTGENMSPPATDTSDAVIALDLATGERRWLFQGVADDIWNSACRVGAPSGANCPPADISTRQDFDFGGGAVIASLKDGRELVIAGQKSGHVWALDPDDGGRLVWSRRFGMGTTLGGVHWGLAFDGTRIFAPINDPVRPFRTSENPSPGVNAVDAATGEVVWSDAATPDCSPERLARAPLCATNYGLSPAPLVIDGAVVTGATDGRLRIFDAASGELLFAFDTNRSFPDTLNGVPGEGGAIDSAPFAAAGGMLFVGSGYGAFSQPPGNVLLAFGPRRE